MSVLSYYKTKQEYRHLFTLEMMKAKVGCRKCKGRGHVGKNLKTGFNIPCDCILVDMDMLAEALNKVAIDNKEKLVIDTNIDALLTNDQPHTEAIDGV